jgi:hypothetical protein
MNHVVFLGDPIFDNARYVPGPPPTSTRRAPGCQRGGGRHCWPWTVPSLAMLPPSLSDCPPTPAT